MLSSKQTLRFASYVFIYHCKYHFISYYSYFWVTWNLFQNNISFINLYHNVSNYTFNYNSTGFISLIVMVGTICYYAKLIITEDFFKNNLLPCTMYIQTFIVGLDLILVILTIIERNDIFFEFNTSPLSQVNEKITEALYKNIISQSQNPEDQGLVNEYLRLSKTNSDVINSAGSSNECSKNNGKKQPFIGPEP